MNHATGKIVDHLATIADIVRLKPREVEHCLNLITMALAKMEPNSSTYAELVAPMVFLKVKDQRLYESYVSGKSPAGEILDHLNSPGLRNRQDTVESMRRTEVLFYLADSLRGKTPALAELNNIQGRLEVIRPELLSEKTRTEGNPAHVQALIKAIENEPGGQQRAHLADHRSPEMGHCPGGHIKLAGPLAPPRGREHGLTARQRLRNSPLPPDRVPRVRQERCPQVSALRGRGQLQKTNRSWAGTDQPKPEPRRIRYAQLN